MLVVCNNREKEWCPYGSGCENCSCDCYYPYELKDGEDRNISCTDVDYKYRECYLIEVSAEELKLYKERRMERIHQIKHEIKNNIKKLINIIEDDFPEKIEEIESYKEFLEQM